MNDYARSLKTATGKEYEISYMASTILGITNLLYIEIIGETIMDLVQVFADNNETNHLYKMIDGQIDKEYLGYTELKGAVVLPDNEGIRITLSIPVEIL